MLLIIILGYVGVTTAFLLRLLRAAARGDRSAAVTECDDPWGDPAPSTVPSDAPAT